MTATERRIYDAVAYEGISAGKLAKETGLCIRRTYKYLRGLKGKKLVFTRRTPKTYGLTCKGEKLASVMQDLQQIVEDYMEFFSTSHAGIQACSQGGRFIQQCIPPLNLSTS